VSKPAPVNALNTWLNTPSGASAAAFCTSLGIRTNADVYGGCLEDIRVTKSEAIAKESAITAMEFAAKDKLASPSKRFCVASGDPHCTNYDGEFFHIQEPGIYTIATSRDGVFEVQEKMRKNGANKVGVPSCMTGAVLRYKQITIEADVANFKKIRVNGVELDLKQDETVKFGGVTIRYGSQNVEWHGKKDVTMGLKMSTPEGFGLLVIGGYCGVLETSVPANYYGRMGGICGNADGAKNAADYFSPSGEIMNVNRGAKKWEMTGYNGPTSPISKWQLAWKPIGSRCYFAAGCEAPVPVAAPRVVPVAAKVVPVAATVAKVVAPVAATVAKVVAPVAKVVAAPTVAATVAKVVATVAKVVAPVAKVVATPRVVPVAATVAKIVAPVAKVVATPRVVPVAATVAKIVATNGFKVYGNYCGPNYCGGQLFQGAEGPNCRWGVMPKDSLDACCKVHDQCCGLNRGTGCNKEILSCINKVKCEGAQCRVAQLAMRTTFVAMQNRVCGEVFTKAPASASVRSFASSKADVIGNVNNMHSRIVSIIHETQNLQKREIEQNKKNVDFSQADLDEFTMKQDDEQKQLIRLQASIVRVNASIAAHYAQMSADSLYLQKLDLIKPRFLHTLDATNADFSALSAHVSNLVSDEHKKVMQDILARSQNQTVYDTRDMAQAFLAHYEKYKHVLRADSTAYAEGLLNLKDLNRQYASGQTVFSGLKAEVARLRVLLASLKKSVSASEADAAMFLEIEKIISEILSSKKTKFATDGANKECAVSVLKAHVANGLI